MWFSAQKGSLAFWQVEKWSSYDWLCHGFTTKDWGNLALHVGDIPEKVLANRTELGLRLGFPLDNWVVGSQVHQTQIMQITAADKGRGAYRQADAVPDTDGLVTDEPGILLVSFYADCVPLFFVVPDMRVVGTAHAGWRGTAGGVAIKMIEKLAVVYGAKPEQIEVAVGPRIASCCYQVGEEVAAQFPESVRQERQGRTYIDLAQANLLQLQASGIDQKNIYTAEVCTCCDQQFFSYRREGNRAGRMAAVIGIF